MFFLVVWISFLVLYPKEENKSGLIRYYCDSGDAKLKAAQGLIGTWLGQL